MPVISRMLWCSLLVQLLYLSRVSVAQTPRNISPNTRPSADDIIFTPEATFRQANFSQANYTFDFVTSVPGTTNAPGGSLIPLNIGSNKALVKQNVGGALITLNPCGTNTPHIHPRSTEIAHVIQGNITFGIIEENGKGSRVIIKHVTEGQSIFLPQGYIHYQHNLNDKVAKFVAGFSTPDAGTVSIAKAFFKITPKVIAGALGISLDEANNLFLSVNRTQTIEQGPGGPRGCLSSPNQLPYSAPAGDAPTDSYNLIYPSGGGDTGYPYYQNGGGNTPTSLGGSSTPTSFGGGNTPTSFGGGNTPTSSGGGSGSSGGGQQSGGSTSGGGGQQSGGSTSGGSGSGGQYSGGAPSGGQFSGGSGGQFSGGAPSGGQSSGGGGQFSGGGGQFSGGAPSGGQFSGGAPSGGRSQFKRSLFTHLL